MRKRKLLFPFLKISKYLVGIPDFINFFSKYLRSKLFGFSVFFENNKNIVVKLFMIKRGRYSRPFLHAATMVVLGVGVIIAPFIANTYPVFSQNIQNTIKPDSRGHSITVGENIFQTDISQKPRDKIVSYTVQRGDTISTIAQKYGIDEETIKAENDLVGDSINVDDSLDILPVTGVSYKVQSGDTVYSIAKKFDTDPQKIVDFPFNDFANPETFSLVSGQMLIVPDGVEPSAIPTYRKPVFIAQGPKAPASSAGFAWPLSGAISQFAAWYHMAIDITAPTGTPVVAANSGTVSQVITGTWDGGYGNNVYVDNGNGYQSHYAHLSGVNVSPGQSVVGGSTVLGWVGLTGRTTGSHLHFEILQNGVLVNPLLFLQ